MDVTSTFFLVNVNGIKVKMDDMMVKIMGKSSLIMANYSGLIGYCYIMINGV